MNIHNQLLAKQNTSILISKHIVYNDSTVYLSAAPTPFIPQQETSGRRLTQVFVRIDQNSWNSWVEQKQGFVGWTVVQAPC